MGDDWLDRVLSRAGVDEIEEMRQDAVQKCIDAVRSKVPGGATTQACACRHSPSKDQTRHTNPPGQGRLAAAGQKLTTADKIEQPPAKAEPVFVPDPGLKPAEKPSPFVPAQDAGREDADKSEYELLADGQAAADEFANDHSRPRKRPTAPAA